MMPLLGVESEPLLDDLVTSELEEEAMLCDLL